MKSLVSLDRFQSETKPYFASLTDQIVKHKVIQYPGEEALITVDLSLPHAELVQAFKLWLRGQKHASGSNNQIRLKQNETKHWVQKRLLPFIDLRIWAASRGVKISQRVFADLLFPDGEADDQVIIKTTSPKANALMAENSHLLNRLHRLAALDPERTRWMLPLGHLKISKR